MIYLNGWYSLASYVIFELFSNDKEDPLITNKIHQLCGDLWRLEAIPKHSRYYNLQNFNKQIQDFEKLIQKHRVKLKINMITDNYALPTTYDSANDRPYVLSYRKYDSNKYDYQLNLRICNDFSKGFFGIFNLTQLQEILQDKRL